MKRTKILKFLWGGVISLSLFLTISCEKDLYENGFQKENKNITVKHISLKDLETNVSSKINSKISEIKKLSSKPNDSNRFEYNSELDLNIDTENGTLVNNDGKLYYTFSMYRESEENLENIIFTPDASGEFETFIAKYSIKPNEFNELTIDEKEVLVPQIQRIYFNNNLQYICIEQSFPITIYPNCDQPGIPHENGQICSPETIVYTFTMCSFQESGGGSNPDDNGNNTGGGTGGTGGTGSGDGISIGGDDEISTSPVGISAKDELIKRFKKQLSDGTNGTPNQEQCFDDLEDEDQINLENLLNTEFDNECSDSPSTEEEQFDLVEELMSELCSGSKIDFENKIILGPSFINNQKAMCVYNKLKLNQGFNKVLTPFNANDPEAFIKLTTTTTLPNSVRAETSEPDSNQIITISLNSCASCQNGINYQPNTMVAQTLIHEVVHAEFFRQIIKAINCENYAGTDYNTIVNALKNSEYSRLSNYFRTTNDWSHNYMAEHFRKTIARVTQEFDTGIPVSGDPLEQYVLLAWRGLMIYEDPIAGDGVIAWMDLVDTNPNLSNQIQDLINNFVTSNANQTCQ